VVVYNAFHIALSTKEMGARRGGWRQERRKRARPSYRMLLVSLLPSACPLPSPGVRCPAWDMPPLAGIKPNVTSFWRRFL